MHARIASLLLAPFGLISRRVDPIAKLSHDLRPRDVGGILICTGANATGHCSHDVYQLKTCHQLQPPLLGHVGTFAPDGEPFTCFPRLSDCGDICRSPTGCTVGAVNFTYRWKYDLAAIGWDGLFRSFDCEKE